VAEDPKGTEVFAKIGLREADAARISGTGLRFANPSKGRANRAPYGGNNNWFYEVKCMRRVCRAALFHAEDRASVTLHQKRRARPRVLLSVLAKRAIHKRLAGSSVRNQTLLDALESQTERPTAKLTDNGAFAGIRGL
jgi:hypothetical protein